MSNPLLGSFVASISGTGVNGTGLSVCLINSR